MTESIGTILDRGAPALLLLLAGSVIVLGLAWLATRLMRDRSASARHAVWAAAVCSLLLLPIASLIAPSVPVPVLPSVSSSSSTSGATLPVRSDLTAEPIVAETVEQVSATQTAEPISAISASTPTLDLAQTGDSEKSLTNWTTAAKLTAVWAAVVLLLLTRVVMSRLALLRLETSAKRLDDFAWRRSLNRICDTLGIRREVTLLATSRTTIPLTWGSLRPVVLLPANATSWSGERREAVLVHELAHVARGDAISQEIARIAAAVYWVNPLVWVALRMMRIERERACDDMVLSTGARASSYASELLEIARGMSTTKQPAAAALAMARPSDLEGRLLAILDEHRTRRPVSRAARVAVVALAIALVVPLAALRPAAREVVPAALSQILVSPPDSHDVHLATSETAPMVSIPNPPLPDTSVPIPPAVGAMASDRLVPDLTMPNVSAPSSLAFGDQVQAAIVVGEKNAGPAPVQQSQDLETLIAVAAAAASLTSDFEKAELLLEVLARGTRNDSLQRTVIRSAATIDGSYERSRVLLRIIRIGLSTGSASLLLGAIREVDSQHERANLLVAVARTDVLADADVREQFLAVAESLTSEFDYGRVVRAAGLGGSDRPRRRQ